jgi:O-antigen/teichoic acid export membrane protein
MNNDILNKKTTTGVVVIMIVYVIFRFTGPLLVPLYLSYIDPEMYGEVLETRAWLELVQVIFTRGFGLAVGIFLLYEAKKVHYNKALWFCLGTLFSLTALVLFYIYRIYQNTRPKDDNKSATNMT